MNHLTTEQRHLLAVEVMGWTALIDLPCPGGLWDGDRTRLISGSELQRWRLSHGIKDSSSDFLWEPDHRIDQAFILAEKVGYLDLHEGGVFWDATIEGATGCGPTPALAICNAALVWLDRRRRMTA